MSNNLKVKINVHVGYFRRGCDLCGGVIEKTPINATLVDETADGKLICFARNICPECLAAGRAGAAARMLEFAIFLRDQAQNIENLAEQVQRIVPENWVTGDDFERVAKITDLEIAIAMTENEPDEQHKYAKELARLKAEKPNANTATDHIRY